MRKPIPIRHLWLSLFLLIACTACSSLDCTLNNTVYATYNFYTSGSEPASYTLTDTLTVRTQQSDSILLNSAYDISTMTLPMSYTLDEDTLLFQFRTTSGSITDTVFVAHTNRPHFESLECGTAMFHDVTGVRWTRREPSLDLPICIDSIAVQNATINYESHENFKLFMRTY